MPPMPPMPPPPGIAGSSFFGASATIASVVIIRPAIDGGGSEQRFDEPEYGRARQREGQQHHLQKHQQQHEPPVRRQSARPVQQCEGIDELERLDGQPEERKRKSKQSRNYS